MKHTLRNHPADAARTRLAAIDGPACQTILHDLMEMAAQLARQVHAQLATRPNAGPLSITAAAIAFECVAAALRRTITVATKCRTPNDTRSAQVRAQARSHILQQVEDAIRSKAASETPQSYQAGLEARMEAEDVDDDLTRRPITEIMAEICCDLAIIPFEQDPAAKHQIPKDIANLCVRAARLHEGAQTGIPRGAKILPYTPRTKR